MLALMRISSRKGGKGAIIASTMARTAIGIANSRQFAATVRGVAEATGELTRDLGAGPPAGLAEARSRGVIRYVPPGADYFPADGDHWLGCEYCRPCASAYRCRPALRPPRGTDATEFPGPPRLTCKAPARAAHSPQSVLDDRKQFAESAEPDSSCLWPARGAPPCFPGHNGSPPRNAWG